MPVIDTYHALLATDEDPGYRWNATLPAGTPVIVTYRFLDGADLPPLDRTYYDGTGVTAFNAKERRAFRLAAEEYEREAGIRFVEVDGPAMIDAYSVAGIGARNESYAGYANYPYVTDRITSGGDLVINIPNSDQWAPGGTGFAVLLHELGHAVGLKHTHEGRDTLSPHLDNHDNTVMSYHWGSAETPETLLPLDRQALRHLYGRPEDTDDWTFRYKSDDGFLKIRGGRDDDAILVPGGEVRAWGGRGADTMYGRENADRLNGGAGGDTLRGYADDDRLSGQRGNDDLFGGNGADLLKGGGGRDKLSGGRGNDELAGGGGQDRLSGAEGRDALRGGGGDDNLRGGGGRDRLEGGAGSDRLDGGAGNDVLRGGGGRDRFVFREGHDRIAGWQDGETIAIDRAALGMGGLRRADLDEMAEIRGERIVFDFDDSDSLTIDFHRRTDPVLGHVLDDVVFV
ncbi:type I secretion protein [uncultured Jannaschia sp.]|uniref:type I secretion protein n=1 Tax=uncultured Jannaschia sp. TaxID=293347 RepID=UPI00262EE813|nr:type I secretion protein [uncultured Jannaschia sp.]